MKSPENNRGPWMQTYTGRAVHPLDIRASEICIEDIAHSLAMQCRYAGHSKFHYSVAQHCVLLSHAVDPAFAAEALMHDAAEAYLVDVPRPVKSSLQGYGKIEKSIEAVIASKFGLEYPWPAQVMEADHAILNDERNQVMSTPPRVWENMADRCVNVKIFMWTPKMAEDAFMARFEELMG